MKRQTILVSVKLPYDGGKLTVLEHAVAKWIKGWVTSYAQTSIVDPRVVTLNTDMLVARLKDMFLDLDEEKRDDNKLEEEIRYILKQGGIE